MSGIRIAGLIGVTPFVYEMLWHMQRTIGGVQLGFARGATPPNELADYVHMILNPAYAVDWCLLSNDETKFCFEREVGVGPDPNELCVASYDGSGGVLPIATSPADGSTPGVPLYPMGWTPDDSQLFYMCTDSASSDLLEVRRVDVDGTNETLILATGITNIALMQNPRLSHDGTMFAYGIDADGGVGNRGLWTCNADGTGNTRIYAGSASWGGAFNFHGWSRDDDWLLFTDQTTGPTVRTTRKIHPDGTGQTTVWDLTITTFADVVTASWGQDSLWLPDGSAYLATKTTANTFPNTPLELGFMSTDGSETWSPISPAITGLGSLPAVLNRDGDRVYYAGSEEVQSVLIDGSDHQVNDDMTATSPHDGYDFKGFFRRG